MSVTFELEPEIEPIVIKGRGLAFIAKFTSPRMNREEATKALLGLPIPGTNLVIAGVESYCTGSMYTGQLIGLLGKADY